MLMFLKIVTCYYNSTKKGSILLNYENFKLHLVAVGHSLICLDGNVKPVDSTYHP